MGHTPTPWLLKGKTTSHNDWVIYGNYSIGQWPICSLVKRNTAKQSNNIPVEATMQEANARFIVTACNAHDSLVATLEKALTVLEDCHEGGRYTDPFEDWAITKQARAALALVEDK